MIPKIRARRIETLSAHALLFGSGDEETGGVFTRKILRVLSGKLGEQDSQIERYYDELINALWEREAWYRSFGGWFNDVFGFGASETFSLLPGWGEFSSLFDDNWQCAWPKPARRDISAPFPRELWQRLPMYGNKFLLKLHGVKRCACRVLVSCLGRSFPFVLCRCEDHLQWWYSEYSRDNRLIKCTCRVRGAWFHGAAYSDVHKICSFCRKQSWGNVLCVRF